MEAPKGKHLFGTVKVGEKGQIVIPKEARAIFQIQPGDNLVVLGDEATGLAIMKHDAFLAQVASAVFNQETISSQERKTQSGANAEKQYQQIKELANRPADEEAKETGHEHGNDHLKTDCD